MRGVIKLGSGRKSVYRSELADSLFRYFQDAASLHCSLFNSGQRTGLPFPTLSDWCRKNEIPKSNFHRWVRTKPDFREARSYGVQLQANLLDIARRDGLTFKVGGGNGCD